MKRWMKITSLAGLLSVAALSGGCIIAPPRVRTTVHAPMPTTVATVPGYNPMYYEGYVIYYDDIGRPMYYANGAPYYVPATYPRYQSYVQHYHTYRVPYQRWYGTHGVQYRHYRRPGVRTVVRHVGAPPPRPVVRGAPRVVVRPGYAPAPRVVVRPGHAPAPRVVVRPGYAPAPAPTVVVRPPQRGVVVRPAPRRGPPPRRGAPPPPPSPPR